MNIIKRYATSSTNDAIKTIIQKNKHIEPFCLFAERQASGRGQLGTKWDAEPGKNLTCSFFFNNIDLGLTNQFLLSSTVALAVTKTLDKLGLKGCQIKWPNDILTERHQKIAGILIENTLNGRNINHSIIGIGINVNQKQFSNLSHATSLINEKNQIYDLEVVLHELVAQVEQLPELLKSNLGFEDYYDHLYKFNQKTEFIDKDGQLFIGQIQGVTPYGLLKVYRYDKNCIEKFNLKSIKFSYLSS